MEKRRCEGILRQKELMRWLMEYRWDWFATMTFRDIPHPESAERWWKKWAKLLPRTAYWVRGEEWQKRGSEHFHALIGGVEALRRSEYALAWWNMGCNEKGYGPGFCKILPASRETACAYITKYCVKGTGGNIDVGGWGMGNEIIGGWK